MDKTHDPEWLRSVFDRFNLWEHVTKMTEAQNKVNVFAHAETIIRVIKAKAKAEEQQ